jgi:hypothetical protein
MLPICLVPIVHGASPGSGLFRHVRPWLPPEIEVAYVSNVPLHALSLYHAPSPALADYASLATLAALGLDSPESPIAAATFTADSAVYVGGGYRLLAPSAGLGLQGRFEGCSFFRSSVEAVAGYIRLAKASNQGPTPDGLYRTRTAKEYGKEVFVSAAEPDLLTICSDGALAERILARKKEGKPAVVFGPDEAEWSLTNVDAPVWGLRHFAGLHPDPTSPLGGARALPPGYGDPQAVAMAFTLESPSLARVAYLTRRQEGNSGYGQTWGTPSTSSAVHGYRVISMQFDPTADVNGEYQFRLMLTLLGVILAV